MRSGSRALAVKYSGCFGIAWDVAGNVVGNASREGDGLMGIIFWGVETEANAKVSL